MSFHFVEPIIVPFGTSCSTDIMKSFLHILESGGFCWLIC